MKTALITTTLTLALITTLLIAITAQKPVPRDGPPFPIPPEAVAHICGNVVVTTPEKLWIFQVMQSQGCEDIRFVPLPGGYWLAYGTRVQIIAQ